MKSPSTTHKWSFVCAVVLMLFFAVSAEARLSAEATLDYTNYETSDTAGRQLSGNSFTQNYSVLYDTKGSIYNSRVGRYNVSLGYNWSALDTSIKGPAWGTGTLQNSENFQETRGHLLYSGEVLLDPKEMPLRLNAFSHDLTRNSFSTDSTPLISNMFSGNGGLLLGTPNLTTGLNDGTHIDSGATLVAGVKNGMTNGYNEILRHFPMIMLDYRDRIDRDLRAATPYDTHLKKLAFVSLNKKDNWFHYRYTTYTDNLLTDNNYNESQIQIGTVDQTLARRWIDFSNWIQVSTDLQFTKHNGVRSVDSFEEVTLNLFSIARRSSWEMYNFNSFDRYREENGKLTYRTDLPLYVSGILNPDVSWRTRATYKDTHDDTGARLINVLGGYQVEAFKRAQFTLTHSIDVESSNSNTSDQVILSTGVETTSSPRFSRRWSLAASYRFKDYITNSSSSSSTFYSHLTILKAGYTPSNTLRVVVRQENELTQGTYQDITSSVRDVNSLVSQYYSPRSRFNSNVSAAGFRSLSDVSLAWEPAPRWKYTLTAGEEIFLAENSSTSSTTLSRLDAAVDFSNSRIKFNYNLGYSNATDSKYSELSTLSNRALLSYQHSRNLNSSISLVQNATTGQGYSTSSFRAEQKLDYSHYAYGGITRKLFEVTEIMSYSDAPVSQRVQYYSANSTYNYNSIVTANTISSIDSPNKRSSSGYVALGAKYYPLRHLVLAAGGRYLLENNFKDYSLLWYTSIGANFSLLQATLDYYQGKRQSDGLQERKITANVKKQF